MTPAEIREAIKRLVEAGQGASRGEWRAVPKRYEVESVEGTVALTIGRGDGNFIATAANARPALATIAGACVLPVEVVRVLVEAMLVVSRAEGLSREWLAALAAAEAEVARVEVAP